MLYSLKKKTENTQRKKLLIWASLHRHPLSPSTTRVQLSSRSGQLGMAEMTPLMDVGVVDTCVSAWRSQVLECDSALRHIQSG